MDASDKQFLSCPVILAHSHIEPIAPLPVLITELAVLIAMGFGPCTHTTEHEGHALALEFFVEIEKIQGRPLWNGCSQYLVQWKFFPVVGRQYHQPEAMQYLQPCPG
jgi:hypothetical protein